MKALNTYPIEDFLERTKIAIKTNQKNVTLTIKEATDLQNSLSIVMTRLSGQLDQVSQVNNETITVIVDGGKF